MSELPKLAMNERERLPDDRDGNGLHFTVIARSKEDENGRADEVPYKGYLHLNHYDDGRLGEIFIRMGKAGSPESSLDAWAVAVSIALQHGADPERLLRKFVGMRIEPSGRVKHVPNIDSCTSLYDLVARIALQRFGAKEAA